MAKIQKRRTVSMVAEIHRRMRNHCTRSGVSMSSFTEHTLTEALDVLGEPTVDPRDVPLPTPLPTPAYAPADEHFTW